MGFKKVPPEHVALFDAALPRAADVRRKQMFGCPAAFVNGNMFCGAHEESFNVRLDDATRAEAFALGFAPFTVMGKTMREYACLPAKRRDDEAFLREWFQRALDYARTLPPKKPKPKGKAGTATRARR
jgi:TfoX/Sxy family transcriptional regulator of competence genes